MKWLQKFWRGKHILQEIEFCKECGEVIIPVLNLWFHPKNNCSHQDGIVVLGMETETYIRYDDQLQKRFIDIYGKRDITRQKKKDLNTPKKS